MMVACDFQDVIGKRKQDKTHSSTKLNLAEYTNEDGTDQITLPLKFKKSKDTSTLVVLHTHTPSYHRTRTLLLTRAVCS
jgi:hypothetical protein